MKTYKKGPRLPEVLTILKRTISSRKTTSPKNLSISTQKTRSHDEFSPTRYWPVLSCARGVLSLLCLPTRMPFHGWKCRACHAGYINLIQQPSARHLPPSSSPLYSRHTQLSLASRRTRPARQVLLLSAGTPDGSTCAAPRHLHDGGISRC
jgi:hypothetical protein